MDEKKAMNLEAENAELKGKLQSIAALAKTAIKEAEDAQGFAMVDKADPAALQIGGIISILKKIVDEAG